MECVIDDEANESIDKADFGDTESTENFQKFIHNLFEQNGILNDLRAYLRGHIVNVLKSAETGDPLMYQKDFTKRLELTHQALNILIVEYLLRMEFNYSLSVFISEIPLSNMVFEFARTLVKTTDKNVASLYFAESDIWSVLKYLGVKCDSDDASKIFDMYKESKDTPLLNCILNCTQLCDDAPIYSDNVYTSDETLSSAKTDTQNSKTKHKNISHKCKHYTFCKTCQERVKKLKQSYEKKKAKFEKKIRNSRVNDIDLNVYMKTVSVMEQSLIDEMFNQLKTVYEAEVDMIREEEERRVKRSLANHAIQLEKHKEELEESYKSKEVKLEENVQQKKKFLWGLARALREQHESMATAMVDVKLETERLIEKENNLKKQLQDAEKVLKSKGESMRNQISHELKILAEHLESMKKERDVIYEEKQELEKLKQMYDKNKVLEEYRDSREDLKQHYDLLKEELNVLKKCIENKIDSKSLIEKGTVTEVSDAKNVMNNEVNVKSDKLKGQVVNDFKKQKNINFSYSGQDVNGSRASTSVDDVDIKLLKQENERLKALATQQRERLQTLLSPRSRTASFISNNFAAPRMTPRTSASMSSNHACGEQLNLFPNIQSRVLFPGDSIPFIGVLSDGRNDRRHLINQWRAIRCRLSAATSKPQVRQPVNPIPNEVPDTANVANAERNITENEFVAVQPQESLITEPSVSGTKSREKSPKSVLREAKQKLRNNSIKEHPPIRREKSPNAMLKEAKLRLRKLEIEAEAVEQSYLDFRKRHENLRKSNINDASSAIAHVIPELDIKQNKSYHNKPEDYKINTPYKSPDIKKDFDKYLRNYQTKFDIGPIHFSNKNVINKPIPSYTKICDNVDKNINYLETPITEFRKLYLNEKTEKVIDLSKIKNEAIKHEELKILEDNISKIYNIPIEVKLNLPEEFVVDNNDDLLKNLDNELDDKTIGNYGEMQNNRLIKTKENRNVEQLKVNEEKIQENIKEKEINEQLKANEEETEENDKKPSNRQLIIIKEDHNNHNNEKINFNEEKVKENNNHGELDKVAKENENNTEINEVIAENILIVEVENVREENNIHTESKDLLLIVESSVDNTEPEIPTHMTVIISPKDTDKVKTNEFEDDVLNTIFSEDKGDVSGDELSNMDKGYTDEFSNDVDNYNSRSDYGNNSPISLPKTEDDNFWDS